MTKPVAICLWYDNDARGAAEFYASLFPDSSVGIVADAYQTSLAVPPA